MLSDIPVKMIVTEWYDGPVGGVVRVVPDRSFWFFLLDWDSSHRIRLFGLQEIPEFENRIEQLTTDPPKWPVWIPAVFVQPTQEAENWIAIRRVSRTRPDTIDAVLVWDTQDEKGIAIQNLAPADAIHTVSWFDAMDSAEGPRDWFSILGIPRG